MKATDNETRIGRGQPRHEIEVSPEITQQYYQAAAVIRGHSMTHTEARHGGQIMHIRLDLPALAAIEEKKVAEKIIKKLADLQKLASGEIESITMQRDDRYVRVSTADYETQGGEIEGLTDSELEIVKTIIGVSSEGLDESENYESEDEYETVIFTTNIPTIQYVVASHEGPWHGESSRVSLQYAPPNVAPERVVGLVRGSLL